MNQLLPCLFASRIATWVTWASCMSFSLLIISYILHWSRKFWLIPKSLPPLTNPLLNWLGPSVHCEYHKGAQGHSLDTWYALKFKFQYLINNKMLSFKAEDREEHKSSGNHRITPDEHDKTNLWIGKGQWSLNQTWQEAFVNASGSDMTTHPWWRLVTRTCFTSFVISLFIIYCMPSNLFLNVNINEMRFHILNYFLHIHSTHIHVSILKK